MAEKKFEARALVPSTAASMIAQIILRKAIERGLLTADEAIVELKDAGTATAALLGDEAWKERQEIENIILTLGPLSITTKMPH